jgi:hypothetical protein
MQQQASKATRVEEAKKKQPPICFLKGKIPKVLFVQANVC